MPVVRECSHAQKSPRMHAGHLKQCPPCQPMPTLWPGASPRRAAQLRDRTDDFVSGDPRIGEAGEGPVLHDGVSMADSAGLQLYQHLVPRGWGTSISTSRKSPPGFSTCIALMFAIYVPPNLYLTGQSYSGILHSSSENRGANLVNLKQVSLMREDHMKTKKSVVGDCYRPSSCPSPVSIETSRSRLHWRSGDTQRTIGDKKLSLQKLSNLLVVGQWVNGKKVPSTYPG